MNADVWTEIADVKRGQSIELGTEVYRVVRRIDAANMPNGRPALYVKSERDGHGRYFTPYDGKVRIVPGPQASHPPDQATPPTE